MDNILEFAGDHFTLFLTITILLIFALIGCIYDGRKSKIDMVSKNEEDILDENINNIQVDNNKSLAETVNVSKNINEETGSVMLTDESILNNQNNINQQ